MLQYYFLRKFLHEQIQIYAVCFPVRPQDIHFPPVPDKCHQIFIQNINKPFRVKDPQVILIEVAHIHDRERFHDPVIIRAGDQMKIQALA